MIHNTMGHRTSMFWGGPSWVSHWQSNVRTVTQCVGLEKTLLSAFFLHGAHVERQLPGLTAIAWRKA